VLKAIAAFACNKNGDDVAMCVLPVAASPPEDLRVVVPVYGNHGDLLVTWKHKACRLPDEGYVIAFELVYCQLDEHKLCIGMRIVYTQLN